METITLIRKAGSHADQKGATSYDEARAVLDEWEANPLTEAPMAEPERRVPSRKTKSRRR